MHLILKKFLQIDGAIKRSLTVLLLFYSGLAVANFVKVDEITLDTPGSHHGIAYDGTNWHIAQIFDSRFWTYDSNFDTVSDNQFAASAQIRGLTYNQNSGNLIVGDFESSLIYEITLEGDIVSSFDTGVAGSGPNALAYDGLTNSVWLAYFSGVIQNRTLSGSLIYSFDTSLSLTGLAFDEANNSLLALETSDTLYEFDTDGSLIGQLLFNDQITGNGQGLAYDASTGMLYATTQLNPGTVTIFQDSARVVPIPAALWLFSSAVAGLLGLRAKT